MYGDRFVAWVLWGFLVCPSELTTAEGLAVFKLAAESGFVLHVAESKTLRFHEAYEALFEWFPPKGASQFGKDIKVSRGRRVRGC